jgi:hypothetical protein
LGSLSQLQDLRITGGQNNLGTLPPEWGQLQNLHVLQLSNMSLTGQLPKSYANMTGLTSLYLRNVTGLTSTLTDWVEFINRPLDSNEQQTIFLEGMGMQGSVPAGTFDPNRCGLCTR